MSGGISGTRTHLRVVNVSVPPADIFSPNLGSVDVKLKLPSCHLQRFYFSLNIFSEFYDLKRAIARRFKLHWTENKDNSLIDLEHKYLLVSLLRTLQSLDSLSFVGNFLVQFQQFLVCVCGLLCEFRGNLVLLFEHFVTSLRCADLCKRRTVSAKSVACCSWTWKARGTSKRLVVPPETASSAASSPKLVMHLW